MADLLQQAVENALKSHFPKIKELTSQQLEISKAIFLRKQDVFAILPTGHGKSLPFQIAPFIARELGQNASLQQEEEAHYHSFKEKDIVISPLLAIMDLQVKALNKAGIPACSLHDESIEAGETFVGDFHIIFGTPRPG